MTQHRTLATLGLAWACLSLLATGCSGAAPAPTASPTPAVVSTPTLAAPSPSPTALPTASPTLPPTPSPTLPPSPTSTLPPTPAPTLAPTPTPTLQPPPTTNPPTASPTAGRTPIATGAALSAPDEISAGSPIEVAWIGPDAQGDYVTIVAAGTPKWTNEPYFYTVAGSPGHLVAPTTPADYELLYANGADDAIAVRRPIKVTPFVGTLAGPDTVGAGTVFAVAWTGPNGPGDYVTIVAAGTERWTNEDYFYTTEGTPGSLIAPIANGAYELWYVTGADPRPMVRETITVSPLAITLTAPASVSPNAPFQVTWTGPNGPRDYITIVPAGSADGTYRSYAYTAAGNPAMLTAPDGAGPYEIWYASDRIPGTFARIPIEVK